MFGKQLCFTNFKLIEVLEWLEKIGTIYRPRSDGGKICGTKEPEPGETKLVGPVPKMVGPVPKLVGPVPSYYLLM